MAPKMPKMRSMRSKMPSRVNVHGSCSVVFSASSSSWCLHRRAGHGLRPGHHHHHGGDGGVLSRHSVYFSHGGRDILMRARNFKSSIGSNQFWQSFCVNSSLGFGCHHETCVFIVVGGGGVVPPAFEAWFGGIRGHVFGEEITG
ncbi:protein kinase domain-containing protein [Pycnococcus provasolii]